MSLLVLISESQDTIFFRVHEFNIDSAEYLWCISNTFTKICWVSISNENSSHLHFNI